MNEEKATLDFEMKDDVSSKAKNLKENLKNTEKQANSTGKALDSMSENSSKSISNLSKSFKSGVLGAAVRKVADYMITSSKASADYIESLNLLGVAFEGDTKAIREFTSTTAGKLNLDEATLINASGHFRTLADSMNLSSEAGKDFSQLLTQLNLDLSSLFNVDFDRMQRALQSAVEGQGKSLKQLTGASVLETSVQTQLTALGVDAYVEDMNDSEKAIARLIAITYQLQSAQGDLANTINAPANQMRVFGEQASMLARNIGNILLPVLSALLPILNGILIAINSILSGIAKLFGFKESDYDFVTDTTDSFNNLGGAVGGVGDAAKKAKKELSGLRGFDKLNVIRTPQDSSGGGGGGGGGTGVNPKLLKTLADLLGQYDSKLDGVRTKAQDIADAILEWLHVFDKLKEPMEHLASLTFDGIIYLWENALKPLAKWVGYELIPTFIDLVAAGLELIYQVGLRLKPIYKFIFENILSPFTSSIGNAVIDALEDITKFIGILSKSKLATQILAWVTAFKQLKTIASIVSKIKIKEIVTSSGKTNVITLGRYLKDLKDNLLDNVNGIGDWKQAWKNAITLISPSILKTNDNMSKTEKSIVNLKNKMSALKTVVKGLIVSFAGFEVLKGSFKDIVKNGTKVGNVLGVIAGSVLLVAGAMITLNAVFAAFGVTLMSNPIFLIVGVLTAAAVAIGVLSQASKEHSDFVNRLDESYKNYNSTMKDLNQSFEETKKQSEETYLNRLAELEVGEQYVSQLSQILDENGRVQSGKEQQAKDYLDKISEYFGTEYELQNNTITLDDKIIDNKGKLIGITDELAKKIEKQALLEAYEAQYKDAIITQMKAKQAYNDVMDTQNQILQETIEKLKNQEITADEAEEIIKTATENQSKAQQKYDDTIKKTNDTINKSGDVSKAYANGTADDMKAAMGAVTDETETASTKQQKTFEKNTKILKKEIGKQKTYAKELSDSMTGKKVTWTIKLNTKQCRKDYNKLVNDISGSSSRGSVKINPPSKIKEYYAGGLPSVGQMFIANERGPELVGQIGGQSFVANQNQMMDIIDKKLQNAGGGIKNATFVVQVGNEQIGKVVINDLNKMAKSNGKPIVIGG